MLRLFEISGGGPLKNKFLLMGDFVDRGKQGIEVMCLLLVLAGVQGELLRQNLPIAWKPRVQLHHKNVLTGS